MAFEKLNKLATTVEELQEKLKQLAQAEIKPALEEAVFELRAQIPTLEKVAWAQYRPYFNDGDACLFSVHGVYGSFDKSDPYEGDHELCSSFKWLGEPLGLNLIQNDLLNKFDKVIELLGDGEGSPLHLAFDDSVKVTINIKTGRVSTENYDHD